MDVLAKSGVKPVWIERSLRIKEAEKRLLNRVEGEWARVVLEAWEEGNENEGREGGRARWRERVEGMGCLREDLAWVNAEIDLYNLQVPSMSLQRMRLTLDQLLEAAEGGEEWMDKTTARAVVRAGEKEGVFSSVTALGSLRLEAEELKRGGRRGGRGSGGVSSEGIWGGGGSGSGGSQGGGGGGGGIGGGFLDTLTSWFSTGQKKS